VYAPIRAILDDVRPEPLVGRFPGGRRVRRHSGPGRHRWLRDSGRFGVRRRIEALLRAHADYNSFAHEPDGLDFAWSCNSC
jgi:hypothetical protein